jgi:iron complex transport system permease protein
MDRPVTAKPGPVHPGDPFAPRRRGVAGLLAGAVLVVGALSLGMGAVTIRPAEVVSVLVHRLGLSIGSEPGFQADAVVWSIRLPRLLAGLVAGGALGLTGAALQGVFRNRLVDPQLLGIGPGASLGAAIGAAVAGTQTSIAGGIATGILTALVIGRLGRNGDPDPSRLVLTGVALGLAVTAWVGFVVFGADSTRIPPIEFWLLGSLTGSTWRALAITAAVIAAGSAVVLASARSLDVLALGDAEARHLGVDVDRITTLLLVTAGAVTGATVGLAGVIGFVGLLVPQLVKRLVGPSHRHVLAASALGGAVFVAAADILSRTVASPTDIPVGLVTAAVGGPYFIWLLRRSAVI